MRRTLVLPPLALALLALPMLAGCLGDDGGRAPVEPGPARPLAVGERVKVADLRNAQSEAFIAPSRDGQTLLTCLHGEFQGPSLMYASTDAGATWRELTASPTPGLGGDCEVALTDDGGWHFVHTQAAGITLASTFDQGGTWRVDRLAGPPVTTFSDRPWLESSGTTLVLTYAGYAGMVGRVSQDSGATWGLPQVIVDTSPALLPMSGHLTIGADGTVIQPFVLVEAVAQAQGGEGVPQQVVLGAAVSTDLGQTWTQEVAATELALPIHPAAAVGSDGDLHVSAFVPDGDGYTLAVWSSPDQGAQWARWDLLRGLQDPARAWADALPDGRIDFVVTDANATFGLAGEGPAIALVRADPAHRLAAPQVVVVGHDHNEFSTVAHDPAGKALVVFTEGSGGLGTGATPGSALWFVAAEALRPLP